MFCAGEEYDGEREDTEDEKEKSHLSSEKTEHAFTSQKSRLTF